MIPKSTDDFCSHAAVELGRKLFPLFALALDLDDDFFEDKTKSSAANMNMLHYPPQTGPVNDKVIGIGAHTECVVCNGISWPLVHSLFALLVSASRCAILNDEILRM